MVVAIGYAPVAEELRMFVVGLIGNVRPPPAFSRQHDSRDQVGIPQPGGRCCAMRIAFDSDGRGGRAQIVEHVDRVLDVEDNVR